MNQLLKKILAGILICFASLYLTFIVDAYTLDSAAEKFFVFCYFCIMSWVVLSLKKKFIPTDDKKSLWIAALVSGLLLMMFQNTFQAKN